jgi:hypothetical protein
MKSLYYEIDVGSMMYWFMFFLRPVTVNSGVSLECLFVCYSLQMEDWMVEVTILLIVLCGGSHESSLLYLWVFVGGFHSVQTCWSSPHSSCKHTQLYLVLWGCCV